ncbi:MAG: hypothetical protein WBX38_21030 [Candidatus Sulfotelmatobacter sp.]
MKIALDHTPVITTNAVTVSDMDFVMAASVLWAAARMTFLEGAKLALLTFNS